MTAPDAKLNMRKVEKKRKETKQLLFFENRINEVVCTWCVDSILYLGNENVHLRHGREKGGNYLIIWIFKFEKMIFLMSKHFVLMRVLVFALASLLISSVLCAEKSHASITIQASIYSTALAELSYLKKKKYTPQCPFQVLQHLLHQSQEKILTWIEFMLVLFLEMPLFQIWLLYSLHMEHNVMKYSTIGKGDMLSLSMAISHYFYISFSFFHEQFLLFFLLFLFFYSYSILIPSIIFFNIIQFSLWCRYFQSLSFCWQCSAAWDTHQGWSCQSSSPKETDFLFSSKGWEKVFISF